MPIPIRYPDITGFRAGFNSTTVKVDGQEFTGYKEFKGSRKRERGMVKGANADPLGKTRGSNTYEASITVYVAEFNAFFLQHFGRGYGDRMFTFEFFITENGYDTQHHICRGCTIDETEVSSADGNDAIAVPISLNPVKILFNGIDDNLVPLRASPAIG